MQSNQQLKKLGIYGERKANLLKLRDHLKTVPQEKFYMGTFFAIGAEDQNLDDLYDIEAEFNLVEPALCDMNPVEEVHECGSVTCAIGRGPAAGIPVRGAESWQEYLRQNFIDYDALLGSQAEDFLFSPDWQYIDITPTGVAKRIDIILESGLECWPVNERATLKYFMDNLPYELNPETE